MAALFTVTKIRKQPKYPSIDEWIKQLWYIYTMEHSHKKEENVTICDSMDGPGNIMLSEISQSEKHKYHMISLICSI